MNVVLRVLTWEPKPPANLVALPTASRCTSNAYTCDCEQHSAERAVRVRQGVKRISQPWTPRESRRAA